MNQPVTDGKADESKRTDMCREHLFKLWVEAYKIGPDRLQALTAIQIATIAGWYLLVRADQFGMGAFLMLFGWVLVVLFLMLMEHDGAVTDNYQNAYLGKELKLPAGPKLFGVFRVRGRWIGRASALVVFGGQTVVLFLAWSCYQQWCVWSCKL